MKINRNQRKPTKTNRNQRKSTEINENKWKPTEINENQRKPTKTTKNQWKQTQINENQWKPTEANENHNSHDFAFFAIFADSFFDNCDFPLKSSRKCGRWALSAATGTSEKPTETTKVVVSALVVILSTFGFVDRTSWSSFTGRLLPAMAAEGYRALSGHRSQHQWKQRKL